jgi:hypothetical protein
VSTTAYPVSVSHPYGPPTVAGTTITVEQMLRQPTRINRMIMDLTREKFISDLIFARGGGVVGGAVVFDKASENEPYAGRDVEQIAPAGEFPILTSEQLAPDVAEVEKWGGKVFITDEARDRNDQAAFTRQVRQIANTVVRKLNQRAVEALNDAIAGGTRDVIGNDWSTYDPEVDPPQDSPGYDFGRADMIAETDEMGMNYNLWIVNPQEVLALQAIYGPGLEGLPPMYSTPRMTAGEALVVAQNQAGQQRIEKPLGTVSWREDKTERTWVQSSVRPLWFVDNIFAVLHYKGLDGTP